MVVMYSCTSTTAELLLDSGLVSGARAKSLAEPQPQLSPSPKKSAKLPVLSPGVSTVVGSKTMVEPLRAALPVARTVGSSGAGESSLAPLRVPAGTSQLSTAQATATSAMSSVPSSSARHVRIAHDATDALKDDVASHGKRLNPQRVMEKRQQRVALEHLHESPSVAVGGADPRADPSAALGAVKLSPYSMVYTLNPSLLPQTPHLTPEELRELRAADFDAQRPGGAGGEAQRWLRQVASEAALQRRPQPKRFHVNDVLEPLQQALAAQLSREEELAHEMAQRASGGANSSSSSSGGGGGGGVPEEERLRARVELYAAALLGRVAPKVGQLDGQLGLILSTLLSELLAHAAPLATLAAKARESALTSKQTADAATRALDAAKAHAAALHRRDEALDSERERCAQEAVRARTQAEGLEHELNKAREKAVADAEALSEAVTASRQATVQMRESAREAQAAFNKTLSVRLQMEDAIMKAASAQAVEDALRAELAEQSQTIERIRMADTPRVKDMEQRARQSHMGMIDARNKLEQQEGKLKALEAANAQLAAQLDESKQALQDLRDENANVEYELTSTKAHQLRLRREADGAEGARRAQQAEVDKLYMQVLSYKGQLAESHAARVDAWAKLQAIYSGDAASHLVREVLLIDELEALEESCAQAWEQLGEIRKLAEQAASAAEELEEHRAIEKQLRDELKDTTLLLARSQTENVRLQQENALLKQKANGALDFAQDAERMQREAEERRRQETSRLTTDLQVVLLELRTYEKHTVDALNALSWKIKSQQDKLNGIKPSKFGARQESKPDLTMGVGGSTKESNAADKLRKGVNLLKKAGGLKKPIPQGFDNLSPSAAPSPTPALQVDEPWAVRERMQVQLTPSAAPL
jgi:hypothetical protein